MYWNEWADRHPDSRRIPRDKAGNVITPAPKLVVEPKPGEVYEWTTDVFTAGGRMHLKGSTLKLIEQTGMAPWKIISSRGYNWLVEATSIARPCWFHCILRMPNEPCESDLRTSVSVWSSIEQSIDSGYIKLKEVSNGRI